MTLGSRSPRRVRRSLLRRLAWVVAAALHGDPMSISSCDFFSGLQTQLWASCLRVSSAWMPEAVSRSPCS